MIWLKLISAVDVQNAISQVNTAFALLMSNQDQDTEKRAVLNFVGIALLNFLNLKYGMKNLHGKGKVNANGKG